MSNNKWLLVLGCAAVLAALLGWPSIKSTTRSIGHQLSRGLINVARTLDPSGPSSGYDYNPSPSRRWQPGGEGDYREATGLDPLSRGEGDYADLPGRRLRLPPGSGYDRTSSADGFPRDRQGHPRRWRICMVRPGHVQQCGQWQTGPAPEGK